MNSRNLAYIYFMTVPWVVIAASVAGISVPLPGIGKMRHTGFMWIATLLSGLLILSVRSGRKITFPVACWAPFFFITFLSLQWSDMNPTYNIQLSFQMLVYFVVGIVSSFAVESTEDVEPLNWMYTVATILVGILCVWFMLGPGREFQGQTKGQYTGFAERPAGMSFMFIAAFFLAQLHRFPVRSLVMWLLAFVFCIISEGRMVTALVLVLWLIHPRLANVGTRIAIIGLVLVMGLVAFNTPIIQERFFDKKSGHAGKGSVDDVASGNFDSAGRFDAWPKIFRKAQQHPIFGHGNGQSQPYTYRVWPPMDKPHNEYLKLFFDMGLIGVSCYAFALIGTWWNLSRVMRESAALGIDNWPATVAYMSTITFALISVVDNPLVLGNNFLHPVFAMIGAANAILYHAKRRAFEDPSGKLADQSSPVLRDTRTASPAQVPLR